MYICIPIFSFYDLRVGENLPSVRYSVSSRVEVPLVLGKYLRKSKVTTYVGFFLIC